MLSQKQICMKYGAIPCRCADHQLITLADATIGELPINGRRLPQAGEHSGWEIWCGVHDHDKEPALFRTLPAFNIQRSLAEAFCFLALPPGYCFLIAGGYHKVWFDSSLIAEQVRNR